MRNPTSLSAGAASVALFLSLSQSAFSLPISSRSETYDYIVVGSGPGGGPLASNLARSGFSVLLLEAGDDQSGNLNTEIPQFFSSAYVDESLRWDFFVRNYEDEERTMRNKHLTWQRADGTYYVGNNPPKGATLLGLYYPRGGTLGGSSAINAMGSVLPSDSDWQEIADLTGDSSWSPEHMREIFERIENNHYLPNDTAGHGFNGWLDTNEGAVSVWDGHDDELEVMKTISEHLGQDPDEILDNVVADVNFLSSERDQTVGVFGSALHVDAMWRRFSSRDYILETAKTVNADGSKKYPLTVQLNTLATKILFEERNSSSRRRRRASAQPKAIGVEYLQGQSVYSADPRHTSSDAGEAGQAYASREVIVAGGTFNSPQLLKLSGVGPASELAAHGIPLVLDLPGVGTNLQDNAEVPIVAHAQRDLAVAADPDAPACTFGAEGDPCVDLWRAGAGPYASFGTLNAILYRSAAAPERDLYMAAGTFAIRGFWPPTDSVAADPASTFALSTVKMHGAGRAGTVLLRSADPRVTPDVNFRLFPDGAAGADLAAELDAIKWARRAFAAVPAPLGPLEPAEPPCAAGAAEDGSCGGGDDDDDDADRQWVMDQAFGHHCTGTCAIGADDDPLAVLDGDFRVRGVEGLRVVDASAFPRAPGAFPALPTFMLSEKATESILKSAAKL